MIIIGHGATTGLWKGSYRPGQRLSAIIEFIALSHREPNMVNLAYCSVTLERFERSYVLGLKCSRRIIDNVLSESP